MKTLIALTLLCSAAFAQLPYPTIPNSTGPTAGAEFRGRVNANFAWLNTNKAPIGHTHSYAALSHVHLISHVTGLQLVIDGKANLAGVNVFTAPQAFGATVLNPGPEGTCDASLRGHIVTTNGADGVADKRRVCTKEADGTYLWKDIGAGGSTPGPEGAFPGTDDGTIITLPRTLKVTALETTGNGPSGVDLREENCSTITPPAPGHQALCVDSADHAVKQIDSLGFISLLAPWYGGTSTTSLLIGPGSKTVVTQPGFAYREGQRLGVWEVANPANNMQGTITGISGSSITFTVDKTGGSGTYADWYLGLGNLIPVSHPIGWYFDDGGAVLTPQTKYFSYPFGCTLARWKALLPAGTTASFDIWRTASGGGTPTVANTLVTGTPINASGAETTGTNISSGALPVVSPDDNIAIRLTAVSGATWASIIFRCEQ